MRHQLLAISIAILLNFFFIRLTYYL